MTLISRRKLEGVDPEYGVDVKSEERAGRLVQHVEGSYMYKKCKPGIVKSL